MKKLFLILAGFLLLASCESIEEKRGGVGRGRVVDAQYIINHPEEFSKPCMDSTQKDPNKVCTTELKPVCGCNGITYVNSCKAAIAGVLEFTEGKCSEAKQ
jgi:hypothetical protein